MFSYLFSNNAKSAIPPANPQPSTTPTTTTTTTASLTLSAKDRTPRPATICIKTITGKTATLEADLAGTVLDLKATISDREQIPMDQMRLVFGAREMSDDTAVLGDLNVQSGSIVHIIIRVPGGGRAAKILTAA